MKTQAFNKEYQPVLVFSPLKKLVAIFSSITSASKAFGCTPSNVHGACSGENISCSGYYFRTLDRNVEVGYDDFNKLNVVEYDELCGIERLYYKTKDMSRTGKVVQLKQKAV